jgi:hypothetical protein
MDDWRHGTRLLPPAEGCREAASGDESGCEEEA